MTYKYETHLHTSEGSACGSSSGKEYIKPYVDAGYSGLFVTDHFFGGNCAVPRDLDWSQKIEQYCKGYEKALEESKQYPGFSVFFGIEQTFQGDDYLIYGLDKNWLLAHPEVEHMSHKELFDAVNEQGGLMIQAHPFRLRGYINAIHLHPREIHGIEVYNGGNTPDQNQMAEYYAKTYEFPVTSGSDIHNKGLLIDNPAVVGGMEFNTPLSDVFDYAKRIKNKEGKIIK